MKCSLRPLIGLSRAKDTSWDNCGDNDEDSFEISDGLLTKESQRSMKKSIVKKASFIRVYFLVVHILLLVLIAVIWIYHQDIMSIAREEERSWCTLKSKARSPTAH